MRPIEELFDRLNGTALFDAYYSGKLDVELQNRNDLVWRNWTNINRR